MSAYKKSVGDDVGQRFSRIYLTEFNTAWSAVLESLKSYHLEVSNQESGSIKTKWNDNTSEKNLVDSFGPGKFYLKAQRRFDITVSKGFYNGRPSVKVVIQKEQLVQYDVLEGWRAVSTDSIEENTLLYRIGRIIHVREALARIEAEKTKQATENVKF